MFKKTKTRLANEIQASSMADIAFLLLIFFLVATTIKDDTGLMVKLPLWQDDETTIPVSENNVFSIHLNKENQILTKEGQLPSQLLSEKLKLFILNPNKESNKPSSPQSAVISLYHDRESLYSAYIEVYNEIKRSYNEIREEKAQEMYLTSYVDLSSLDRASINQLIPMFISEAEK